MSNQNSHNAVNIKGINQPFNFGTGTAAQKIELVINALRREATQPENEHRLFLDEMSPAARDSMLAILIAYHASL